MQIKRIIEPLDKISSATNDEHLGTILNLTTSSHEPVFIFDKDDNFLGLISSTLALFHRHYPYTTKVSSELTIPPYIDTASTLEDVVNHMLSTRFYTLPIFDKNKKLIGAVKASRIFKRLIKSPKFFAKVSKKLKINKPITIKYNKKVKDAYKLLRLKKVSRLLVVDNNDKLMGILTRNDLKNAFLAPSPRQRFSKSFGDVGQAMFDEEEIKRSDLPLLNFLRKDVSTVNENVISAQIAKKLIQSKRNSIVLVDKDNHPKGIVSNRDLLLAISNLDNEVDIPIIMEKPRDISGFVVDEVENKIIEMGKKLNKIIPLQRFEVSFKDNKNGIGRPKTIETTLSAKFYTGDDFVVKYESHEVLIGVRETLDRIYKMVRRKTDKKKDGKREV